MTWALKRIYEIWAEANIDLILNRRNPTKSKHIVMVSAGRQASPSPQSAMQCLLWRAAKRMENGEI
jgi:hypothetical protein